MVSLFKQRIEQKAEEAISLNPSVQSGYSIKTSEVIDTARRNPFFLALNNMSANDLIQSDSVMSGVSYVVKTPGVSKAPKTYINPKTFESLFGGSWGKLGDSSQSGIADMVFSGSNNQIPTVIGITGTFIRSEINPVTASQAEVSDNTGFEPVLVQLPPGVYGPPKPTGVPGGPVYGPNLPNQEAQVIGVVPPEKVGLTGKISYEADKTHKGIQNNRVRTGTVLIDPESLKAYTSLTPIIDFIYGD